MGMKTVEKQEGCGSSSKIETTLDANTETGETAKNGTSEKEEDGNGGASSSGISPNKQLIAKLLDESWAKRVSDWFDKCRESEVPEKFLPTRGQVKKIHNNIDSELLLIHNVVRHNETGRFIKEFQSLMKNPSMSETFRNDSAVEVRLQLLLRICFLKSIRECITEGLWIVFLEQEITEFYKKVSRVVINFFNRNWCILKAEKYELPRHLSVEFSILKRLLEKKMSAEKPSMPSSLCTYNLSGIYTKIFWTVVYDNYDSMMEKLIECSTQLSPPHAKLALLKRHDTGEGYAGAGSTKLINVLKSPESIKIEQYLDMVIRVWNLHTVFSAEQ
ncbi:unnamed protein product [Caenorhabditis nigoni]